MPKMDGENNGKPYLNGWFGGKTHYFRKHPYNSTQLKCKQTTKKKRFNVLSWQILYCSFSSVCSNKLLSSPKKKCKMFHSAINPPKNLPTFLCSAGQKTQAKASLRKGVSNSASTRTKSACTYIPNLAFWDPKMKSCNLELSHGKNSRMLSMILVVKRGILVMLHYNPYTTG